MEIKQYAPVIIPTLNRYEHFKRCLHSLECCTGAEYTDVYIGLDYPPSEKYIDGWKKIDAYLTEKEKSNCFKNLFVRRRDHNCGVEGNNSNYGLLYKEICGIYEVYITSEDDNEFSPNFLEYMNKALEKYKNDNRVIKVSAYTPPVFSNLTTNTTFFGIDTPAYGLGGWVQKNNEIHIVEYKELEDALKISFKTTWKLFWTYPALIYMAVHMIKTKRNYGDVRMSMTNLLYGTFSLEPAISLSRNWGADGTGLHSGVVKGLEKETISEDRHFCVTDIPYEVPEKIKKRLFYRNMPKDKIKFAIYLVHKFLYVMKYYFFG